MFAENQQLENIISAIKALVPKELFELLSPLYHYLMAYAAAIYYGFPSSGMKIIGVTGTTGKSTVVQLIAKIIEESGIPVAAASSISYKINLEEAPNPIGNTMPGRFRLQKFLKKAKEQGVRYAIIEVTSEGIMQKRHLGIRFDCAVFTNLEAEHIERHGSFENYAAAKQELFKRTARFHIINADDEHAGLFSNFTAKNKIFYGIKAAADMRAENIKTGEGETSFSVGNNNFRTSLIGEFNIYNILAALSVAKAYHINMQKAAEAIAKVKSIRGRLEEVLPGETPLGFRAFVDYAHTPKALAKVYGLLREMLAQGGRSGRLICVLGAAGGGRDKWKRPEFGRIASELCDEVILTDEDPFDEDPRLIVGDIESGIPDSDRKKEHVRVILERGDAIRTAVSMARGGDIVIATGKGSEAFIRIQNGRKIPWDDRKAFEAAMRPAEESFEHNTESRTPKSA